MASKRKVMSDIEKIRLTEKFLFWIERPAIFLFVFFGGNPPFHAYLLVFFVFTNACYANLACIRRCVTRRPKETSSRALFFAERCGIWLEAMYFIMKSPAHRYVAAAIFVITNIRLIMNLIQILNPYNPKKHDKEEGKQKSLTVEESPKGKDRLSEMEEMPETERTLPPIHPAMLCAMEMPKSTEENIIREDRIVSSKKDEENDADNDSDYDDEIGDDHDLQDEPEGKEEKFPESGENIEPRARHEMERVALIENNIVENEIVSNKGEDKDEDDEEEEEDDYSDDDDCSDDVVGGDSGDDDEEGDDIDNEGDNDDDEGKGAMEKDISKQETKTEEIQENVQAEENSLKDQEVKETEHEKKDREGKDKRNDDSTWEIIEEIDGEVRSRMLSEEQDRNAESEATAALIKEKELLLLDF